VKLQACGGAEWLERWSGSGAHWSRSAACCRAIARISRRRAASG
jgi:hypothetical protein